LTLNPEGRILNSDQLLRVTTIVAIDESLRTLLPRGHAKKWAQTPSQGWRHCGKTPLSVMVDGGILTLWEIRRQLESRAFNNNETER